MSKLKILERIGSGDPYTGPALPEIPFFDDHPVDLLQRFQGQLIHNKAQVFIPSADQDWQSLVRHLIKGAVKVYSQCKEFQSSPDLLKVDHPRDLDDLDMVILEGKIGVADNGAIWVNGFVPRVLPFITKQLILVIEQNRIVQHMHHAYHLLDSTDLDFGVFISGPSKTADIEQALVVGAQGALELIVVIT